MWVQGTESLSARAIYSACIVVFYNQDNMHGTLLNKTEILLGKKYYYLFFFFSNFSSGKSNFEP